MLPEIDSSLSVCVCVSVQEDAENRKRKPSMRTIREALYSPRLVNYVKCQGASVNYCGLFEKPPFTFQQVEHIRDINHFLFCVRRGRAAAERLIRGGGACRLQK